MYQPPQGYKEITAQELIRSGDKLLTPNSPLRWRKVGGAYQGRKVEEFYPMKFARCEAIPSPLDPCHILSTIYQKPQTS